MKNARWELPIVDRQRYFARPVALRVRHDGRVARATINSFLITPRRTNESTFLYLTKQNDAEGAPGSAFWYLGLGLLRFIVFAS
jgi:hypothetical protein